MSLDMSSESIWDILPFEVQLLLTEHLIHTDIPLKTLFNLSLTSRRGYDLFNHAGTWREAVNTYFAPIAAQKRTVMKQDPKKLFLQLYQATSTLLKEQDLSFIHFVNACYNQTQPVQLNEAQIDCLQGLLLCVGRTIPQEPVPIEPTALAEYTKRQLNIHTQGLHFASALGNTHFVREHLENHKTAFATPMLSKAAILCAQTGHHLIFNLLLTHKPQAFDASTRRSALMLAADGGFTKIVAQFFHLPADRVIAFTLKKVVSTAITKNYPEILTLTLRGANHNRFAPDIRLAVIFATEKDNDTIVTKAYELAPKSFNSVTIQQIVLIAAKQGNLPLVTLFAKHPDLLCSSQTVQSAIKIAMQHRHEAIALELITAAHAILRLSVKRDLLEMAVAFGFNSIIRELFNQDIKMEPRFYDRLISIAKANLHSDTVRLIKRKMDGLPLEEEKENRTPDWLDTLSDTFCQLKLSSSSYQPTLFETTNVYTPIARTSTRNQPLAITTEEKRILRNVLL
ncbi:ankyrin repeat domain-containing protein [Candidatus Berkiella aquae]|uniref:Ankyrin repeat domain-containing protein n=1 Tax=Candidatus Berkiella aquae TaxID=295108 RepID=A0A0Q9YDQ3_9GAMM|nr:ankyrin repeat domain-containing protein [Candidatus Berkiella aquae]MCS5709941.1 ankyrin repeat domain-containing protein [Candidatus Berkiella aquae]